MAFCPECRVEYGVEVRQCPDCNVDLVDALADTSGAPASPTASGGRRHSAWWLGLLGLGGALLAGWHGHAAEPAAVPVEAVIRGIEARENRLNVGIRSMKGLWLFEMRLAGPPEDEGRQEVHARPGGAVTRAPRLPQHSVRWDYSVIQGEKYRQALRRISPEVRARPSMFGYDGERAWTCKPRGSATEWECAKLSEPLDISDIAVVYLSGLREVLCEPSRRLSTRLRSEGARLLRQERVEGALCYVIEARSGAGEEEVTTTYWVHPGFGYAVVKCSTLSFVEPDGKRQQHRVLEEYSGFREHDDGIWLPGTCSVQPAVQQPDGSWKQGMGHRATQEYLRLNIAVPPEEFSPPDRDHGAAPRERGPGAARQGRARQGG